MKPHEEIVLVLVTAPKVQVARTIAQAALKNRLAACVNIVPHLESHYWWEGKIESSKEVLLLLKTTTSKLVTLEKIVLANHPYQTPEFIAVPIDRINRNYRAWLLESLTGTTKE